MEQNTLQIGAVVDGGTLPEPIRLVLVQEMGSHKKIAGQGLRSGRYIERVLSSDQVLQLRISPVEESFDGDPNRFRLGIEAKRLGLAYDYDPYFSLSIARIEPLPHQLEAVYDYRDSIEGDTVKASSNRQISLSFVPHSQIVK